MKFGGKLAGKFGARRAALGPDPEIIRALAGLLAETGLTEIEYAIGDHRVRVAREPAATPSPPANGQVLAPVAEPSAAAGDRTRAGAVNGAADPGALTSPIVGIAYLAPQPGAAPFVKLGDPVGAGDALLIIEAMKVMNEIRAPRAGRIARIFVEDAQPVEYGAPLLLIE